MGWQEDLNRALDAAARAVRRATRDAERATRSADITQNVVASGDGYSSMQYTSNGRRVSMGPGYVVVEHTYWLTGAGRITVASNGGVWKDGQELFTGRPVPGYRPGGGITVRLDKGSLSINGHAIGDYVAPPGAEGMCVEQRSDGGGQNIVIG